MQLVQDRIANSAMEMFASAGVLSQARLRIAERGSEWEREPGEPPRRRALSDNTVRELLATLMPVLGHDMGQLGRNGHSNEAA